MDRRSFLRLLGLGTVAMVAAPSLLAPESTGSILVSRELLEDVALGAPVLDAAMLDKVFKEVFLPEIHASVTYESPLYRMFRQ